MEGKTNFSRRLKQFDGLTWLTPDPIILRQTYATGGIEWCECVCVCVYVVSERGVISAESFYHPLRRVWNGQDGAETTVMHGEWTTSQRSECSTLQQRRQLVHVIRSVSATVHRRCSDLLTEGLTRSDGKCGTGEWQDEQHDRTGRMQRGKWSHW